MIGARLVGIDLARFIALVGMMAAHLAAPRFSFEWLHVVSSGFPSTLFAVVGGFGVTFASRRYLQKGFVGAAVAATVGRGAAVALLGFVLEYLPNDPIAIILVYFGVGIICSAPFLAAPTWVLAVTAAMLGVLGPNLLAFAGNVAGGGGPPSFLHPVTTLLSVFLTGTYPVITWLTYLLIGMVTARWVLVSWADGQLVGVSAWLFAGGGLVGGGAWTFGDWYLVRWIIPNNPTIEPEEWVSSMHGQPPILGWDAIFLVSPHSGSTVDILRTGGIAVAIIGACLFIASNWEPVPIVMRPVVAAGSAPLTIYVLHLVATSMTLTLSGGIGHFWDPDAAVWVHWWFFWQVALALAVGATLSVLHRRGPLEVLTSNVAHATAERFLPGSLGNR